MSDTPHDRRVTIITWHYVRDGAPADLHARSVTEFDHQLEHIACKLHTRHARRRCRGHTGRQYGAFRPMPAC